MEAFINEIQNRMNPNGRRVKKELGGVYEKNNTIRIHFVKKKKKKEQQMAEPCGKYYS